MRILVDHGDYGNVGDAAMVEGAVLRLQKLLPRAEIHVVRRPNVQSSLARAAGIHHQDSYGVIPIGLDVSRLPLLWRYSEGWQNLRSQLTLGSLGMGLSAGSLLLSRESAKSPVMSRLTDFCGQFDGLLIAGGGNLTDTFAAEVLRKCCLIQGFAEHSKPIILTGQQLGPFRRTVFRAAVVKALRRTNFIGLREPASLEFCQKRVRGLVSFALMGDDSFGLSPANDECVSQLLHTWSVCPNEFIALNVRIGSYAIQNRQRLKSIGDVIRRVSQFFGMPVLAIPIDAADYASLQQLSEFICPENYRVLPADLTPSLVKGVLGKAFGAIGISYHFCTFALSQGVPAVCFYEGDYYKQKAQGLTKFWDDSRLALPLSEFDDLASVRHIIDVLKARTLRTQLAVRAKAAFQQWSSLFDEKATEAFSPQAGSTAASP